MPRIHLGVYLTSGRECSNAVRYALEVALYSNATLLYKTTDSIFPVRLSSVHVLSIFPQARLTQLSQHRLRANVP